MEGSLSAMVSTGGETGGHVDAPPGMGIAIDIGEDADLNAPVTVTTLSQLMAFMVQQQGHMTELMGAFAKTNETNHLANAKLDIRNFVRMDKFDNKREHWREWEMHFSSCVRECDICFADFIWAIEKRQGTPEDIEIDILSLDPTQSQLAGALYSRLIAVTSAESFRIVEMTGVNGCEAWRLLCKRWGPQTDSRLATLIMSIVGCKIKGRDIQAGLVQWEQKVLELERAHKETLSPKIQIALLMNVLPTWMQSRGMEHLDRLKTYREVREKVERSEKRPSRYVTPQAEIQNAICWTLQSGKTKKNGLKKSKTPKPSMVRATTAAAPATTRGNAHHRPSPGPVGLTLLDRVMVEERLRVKAEKEVRGAKGL